MKPLMQLAGVDKTYRRGDEHVRVLVAFDFTLEAGEFVVVTGPSGAGKSTLLHIAGGLDAPDSGTVAVAGQDVWAMRAGTRAAFRRRNLGFVFQFFNLVPMLTAVQNVSLPLVLDGWPPGGPTHARRNFWSGSGSATARAPARRTVGRTDERVAVARALVARPSLILADEPTGNWTAIRRPRSWISCGRCHQGRRGRRHGDPRPGGGALRLPPAAPGRRSCVRRRHRRARR